MPPDTPDSVLHEVHRNGVPEEPGDGWSGSTLAIVGLGLIGASIALAIRARHMVKEIIGFDRSSEVVARAVRAGIIDSGSGCAAEAASRADLVVIAVPVSGIPGVAREISGVLKRDAVVTDVGSTKGGIVQALEAILLRHGRDYVDYIGGHPMAGSEKAGLSAAEPGLFAGAPYVLTPTARTSPRAVEAGYSLARAVGAIPVELDAERHDRVVACISHLPYIVAVALAETAMEQGEGDRMIAELASSGFRDTTRVASSCPGMSADFCLANRDALLQAIKHFRDRLDDLARDIARGSATFVEKLGKIKDFRDELAVLKGWDSRETGDKPRGETSERRSTAAGR
ncbi:MAG TPA: prephenate dehydrogenase/arogenate dehydrogenase family protein [Firmicutes bacterium]|nr:prephenate dehydrogenase/arogenate dehydrogenase family protein [Bacillota bacterium]